MLTPHELTIHLREKGLLCADAIVNGGLTLDVVSRRNHNYRITARDGTRYLTKQARDESGTLEHEATIYRLLHSRSRNDPLWRYLPVFRDYEAKQQLLVLDMVKNARTIHDHVTRHRQISSGIGALLGRALASIHDFRLGSEFSPTALPPWIVTVPRLPVEILREISSANLETVHIIQESRSFCSALDNLAASWRTDSFIHSDFRWENCLLTKRRRNKKWELKIIDWELAGRGDRDWDVGSVFANFLYLWLSSMLFTPGSRTAALVRSARFPLARLQPAIRSFWRSYVAARGLAGKAASECLLRSIRFAAARLIQLAYERMQQSSKLTGNMVSLLQVSANMLRSPNDAAFSLLGIRAERKAHD